MKAKKRISYVVIAWVLLFFMGVMYVPRVQAASVPSVADSILIQKGKTKKLSIKGKKKGAKVTCSSSNSKVVIYKNGVAEGVSYGTATLTTTVVQDGYSRTLKTSVRVAGKNYSKAMKAYKNYLKKYNPPALSEDEMYDARFNGVETYGFYINSFFLRDMTNDGVPELFTMTRANFRWEIIRVYTYSSGKVKMMKFSNGTKAEFDNNHCANGAFDAYFCTKNHIHNNFGGYYDTEKSAFKVRKGKLVPCDCDRSSHVNLYSSMHQNTSKQRSQYLK